VLPALTDSGQRQLAYGPISVCNMMPMAGKPMQNVGFLADSKQQFAGDTQQMIRALWRP
jgi:hypothetical protein